MKISKEQKEILKLEEKRRELFHKEMIKQDKQSRSQLKIAPSDDVIIFKNINKIYGNHIQAVFGFDLSIKENEFIVLVGPSGCGKSTTLKMIAGLEEITSGDLFLNGKYSNDVTAQDRNLAMVFQSYALYPTMTVYNNIAFPLIIRHEPKDVIDQKVREIAKILELDDGILARRPAALSGGQRQRVALARAMVKGSKLLLMDEPLSNLDAKLRVAVRSEIVSLHKKLGATTIYVTHDQTEAMTMADRIVVMNKGYIQQVGAPQEIYDHPANLFVATFIGSPSMNIADVKYENGEITFENSAKLTLSKENVAAIDKYYNDVIEEINTDIANKENEKANRLNDLARVGYLKAVEELDKYIAKSYETLKKMKNKLASLNETSEAYATLAEEIKLKGNVLKEEYASRKQEIETREYVRLDEEALASLASKDNYVKIYNLDLERMNDMLNKYKEVIANNEKALVFGIRPENIVLKGDSKDVKNLSKEFPIHIDLCELLGHEYYLSFNIGKVLFNLKASANEEILPNIDTTCQINMDKVHIFDPISKRNIF